MSDPSGKKEQRVRLRQICRIEQPYIYVEKVAGMIQRHDDHDEATNDVN